MSMIYTYCGCEIHTTEGAGVRDRAGADAAPGVHGAVPERTPSAKRPRRRPGPRDLVTPAPVASDASNGQFVHRVHTKSEMSLSNGTTVGISSSPAGSTYSFRSIASST